MVKPLTARHIRQAVGLGRICGADFLGQQTEEDGCHFCAGDVAIRLDVAVRVADDVSIVIVTVQTGRYIIRNGNGRSAVVAATAAPHCIITRETLLPLRASRKYRSLFLIDISVPRNISPDVADIDEVYLYDIDTLTQLADEAKRSREQEVSRCEAIIRDSISRYFPDSALYDQ